MHARKSELPSLATNLSHMTKTKLCIVTWFRSRNFGTCLQAFALQYILRNMGYGTVLYNKCFSTKSTAERIITVGRFLKIYPLWESFKLKHILHRPLPINAKTLRWVRKYLYVTNLWSSAQIRRLVKETDCFVTGSDQIWNSYFNMDPDMFLSFAEDKKRIAYSSSIGTAGVNPIYKDQITTLLSRFTHIGVREKCAVEELSRLTSRTDIKHVLDPVLLIPADRWKSICDRTLSPAPFYGKECLLVYALGKCREYEPLLERLRSVLGNIDVCVIASAENPEFSISGARLLTDIDPFDFVNCILHASFVCTDSFHATALSINFNKQFITLKRFRDNSGVSQNSRIYDLLKAYDLQDRLAGDYTLPNLDKPIDFTTVNRRMQERRAESLTYLRSAIES